MPSSPAKRTNQQEVHSLDPKQETDSSQPQVYQNTSVPQAEATGSSSSFIKKPQQNEAEANAELLQQQLLQMQMQQQQALQNLSPTELASMFQHVAQNLALGMMMVPMMPPFTPTNKNATEISEEADGSCAEDGSPKRKRGRPSKAESSADGAAKVDLEKMVKQFPMWNYGMQLPAGVGFPNANVTGQSGAGASESGEDSKDVHSRHLKAQNKKKTRGTGKPRGRPRTRPRPGEIIQRITPPSIAPNNLMYNLQLAAAACKQDLNVAGIPLKPSSNQEETTDENQRYSNLHVLLDHDNELRQV